MASTPASRLAGGAFLQTHHLRQKRDTMRFAQLAFALCFAAVFIHAGEHRIEVAADRPDARYKAGEMERSL